MVEKLGNVIACYGKKEKMPAAVLDRLSCRPLLIGEKHTCIGNNVTARSLKNSQVHLNKAYLVLIK